MEAAESVRQLFGRGSIYTVATGLQLAAGVAVMAGLTRLVPPSEFGIVAVALVVANVLNAVANAGLPSAITREVFEGDDGVARGRGLLVATVAIATVTTVIVDATGRWWAPAIIGHPYSITFRLAVWWTPAAATVAAALAQLRSLDRVRAYLAVSLLASAGAQAAGVGLAWATDAGAPAYLAGVGTGLAVAGLVGLGATRPGLPDLPGVAVVKAALAIGLPTVPHILAMWLLAAGDRLVIEHFLGFAAVGRYHVAYTIGSLVVTFLLALNHAWGPFIYGAPSDDLRWEILARTRDALYMLVVLAVGILGLGAPFGLAIVSPAGYEPVDLVVPATITSLAALPYVAYLVHIRVLFQLRRTGVLVWITPMCAALNLFLNAILVPVAGLLGAAAATVIAYGVLAGAVRSRSTALAPLPRSHWVATRATILGLALAAAGSLTPSDGWWLLLRGAVCMVLLAFFGAAVRGLLRPSGPSGVAPVRVAKV